MDVESTRKKLQKIKGKYEAQFLAIPGVVGVGIGEVTNSDGNQQFTIRIYVEKCNDEILHRLPSNIDGFPVDIKKIGKPKLL